MLLEAPQAHARQVQTEHRHCTQAFVRNDSLYDLMSHSLTTCAGTEVRRPSSVQLTHAQMRRCPWGFAFRQGMMRVLRSAYLQPSPMLRITKKGHETAAKRPPHRHPAVKRSPPNKNAPQKVTEQHKCTAKDQGGGTVI